MKKLLTLALVLALCLSLAVPALAAPSEESGDTFDDGIITISNVLEQKTIDDTIGMYYVKDELTCAAPVNIAPVYTNSSEFTYYVQVDRVPPGKDLKDLEADDLEDYLPRSGTAAITQPGVYYVWRLEYNSNGGGGFVGYLLTVQGDSPTPAPKPGTDGPTASNPFTDVLASDWFYDPVLWAVEKKITTGTSATKFSPNQTCTRAQIITFLWRCAGSPEPKKAAPFTDVKSDAYYAKATAWAAENGMAGGTAFSPESPCTRLMAVEFMWKQAGSPGAAKAGFTDVSSDAVNWAVEKGVTNGTGGTAFSPAQTCTRGQIVTFLYRAFAEQSGGQGNGQSENPNTGSEPKYPYSDIDMTKIKGLYRQEKNPEYEIEAWFANPRIHYNSYHNSEKYGRFNTENGYASIRGSHAYINASDGTRIDMWFYPDSMIYETSRTSQAVYNGKYLLVDPQEEQQKLDQEKQQDQQMEQKYPSSNVDMTKVNGLYRMDGAQPYQIVAYYYGNSELSYRLENYQDEDEDIIPPYSKLTISGSHAYFNSEKHKLRTDIWVYPDYLILEFSGDGAKEYTQYNGRYNLFKNF